MRGMKFWAGRCEVLYQWRTGALDAFSCTQQTLLIVLEVVDYGFSSSDEHIVCQPWRSESQNALCISASTLEGCQHFIKVLTQI